MRCQIIAEVATNHGGDLACATDFIHACAEAGADYVKFQSYQVQHLRPGDPQQDWFAQCELSDDAHHVLMAECEKAGVKFLTTVYTADRVPFLQSLGLDTIKIGSGEAGEWPLVNAACQAFSTVLLSDGLGSGPVVPMPWTTLQCVTRYPTPIDAVALDMQTYAGWSDHCLGIEVAKAAIAMGAQYVEKHVTLPYAPRVCAWDATMAQVRALRDYAAFIETITTGLPPDLTEARARFVGRWQYQPERVHA